MLEVNLDAFPFQLTNCPTFKLKKPTPVFNHWHRLLSLNEIYSFLTEQQLCFVYFPGATTILRLGSTPSEYVLTPFTPCNAV